MRRLLVALTTLTLLAACAAPYPGYRSQCACDYDAINTENVDA